MKRFIWIVVFVLVATTLPPTLVLAESEEDTSSDATEEKEETNEFGIEEGTEVYGEDISELTEEELQYVPEAWREGNFESEHPEEEPSPRIGIYSVYPDVNQYIKSNNLSVATLETDHISHLTKFNYRNGYGKPEGVVAHETANNNSTITGEISYMSRNHKNAFVHAFVDGSRIIEVHPTDRGAWGAGRFANERFIHVELVRVHNFDDFARSINNYADYLAENLYDYSLGVTSAESSGKGSLWSHKAVSVHLGGTTHVDPHGYFAQWGYNWNDFVKLVTERHNKLISAKKANTSRVGEIKTSNAKIYDNPTNKSKSSKAGSKHTDRVYYIKAQAKVGNEQFYLVSTKPSSKKGTIGWVSGKDITTHTHKAVDNKSKTFYFKGRGAAYNRAWGGSKNKLWNSTDFAKVEGEAFQVHKTETVGNNTWYRGKYNGQTLWIHENHLVAKEEKKTSRLGEIKSENANIYSKPEDQDAEMKAGSTHTKQVYYIKKQAKVGKDTFYLISTKPSSKNGTIGWVNQKDITTHSHKAIDNKSKTFYFKGKGSAYNRAWGGSKNKLWSNADFAKVEGEAFQVHKTETVGNNTWYRGKYNGQTLWIHEHHLLSKEEKKTSRVGEIKSPDVNIYSQPQDKNANMKAGDTHTKRVYYIKKQAKIGGDLFYLVSTKPSSEKGTIGWVNDKDIKTYTHKAVDNKSKTFYFKGKGAAYNRAWGGSKNKLWSSPDFAKVEGKVFKVHKTETVGNNTWYRGKYNGQTLWIHEHHLTKNK